MTVPGYGNRKAKILFLGEAPARAEVQAGIPFVGPAGKELNRLLNAVGLSRDEVYTTNCSLETISLANKDNHFFNQGVPTPVFIEGMQALQADIAAIKPNVVVPLGNFALWAMMQHQDIMRYRGSMLWSEVFNVKVIPTLHPAALLRGSSDSDFAGGLYKYRPAVIWDLDRAKEQSGFPELRLKPRDLIVDPKADQLATAYDRLRMVKRLTVDIETHGGLNLSCIGFGDTDDPSWAVTIPWDGSEMTRQIYKQLLESDIPKVGQNLMYDITMLDQWGIKARNIVFDTMLAQHVILPDLPKGLDFLASIYTDIPYYKDEGKVWKDQSITAKQQFWRYNAKDICATSESCLEQEKILASDPRLLKTFDREMRMFEPLRGATYDGLKVNQPLLYSEMTKAEAKRDEAQRAIDKLAGHPVNVFSTAQVKTLIYEERKLPVRTMNGKPTTQARVLKDLAAKTDDPALNLIVTIREHRKILSSYLRRDMLCSDGRLRFTFNIAGTKTGRLSSSAPLWGPGINIQTVPGWLRKLFVPEDGYEFGEFDQSQAEAIVVAYLANDPVHIQCFVNGWDVHRVTACLLMGQSVDNWKSINKNDANRQVAKKCNHGLNYGMGPEVFMMTVNNEWDPSDPTTVKITRDLAYAVHARYHEIRPALIGYWNTIRDELRQTRTLSNVHGRVREFLDMWSDTMHKDAYSWKPQSTVGDSTNIGIIKVLADPDLQRAGVRLRCQVHDSALFSWPREARAFVVPRINRLMEVPLLINGYPIVVPIEAMVGDTWYKGDMDHLGLSRPNVQVDPVDFARLQDETANAFG